MSNIRRFETLNRAVSSPQNAATFASVLVYISEVYRSSKGSTQHPSPFRQGLNSVESRKLQLDSSTFH